MCFYIQGYDSPRKTSFTLEKIVHNINVIQSFEAVNKCDNDAVILQYLSYWSGYHREYVTDKAFSNGMTAT